MALSCVYRTGQRFGVNYLIDVLLGKPHQRITDNGHDQQSTFGIGTALSTTEWHGLFRQLIALGYLTSDIDSYGALRLSDSCKPLLRGEQSLFLRKQQASEEPSPSSRSKKSAISVRRVDEPLFEALREHRKQLADEQGVPPFVILHDKTLQQLCTHRPRSLAELETVNGIGGKKLQRYGTDLIRIIQDHPRQEILDNSLSDTVNQTLQLFTQGLGAENIARQRELSLQTIYNHLSSAIAADIIPLEQVISLKKTELDEIVYALELALDDNDSSLKSVYESLDGAYDYHVLSCVKASLPT